SKNVKLLGSCPEGWRRFGCSCYYLSTELKSWTESRQDCLERGADLVIINSEEEQAFINGFEAVTFAWIGIGGMESLMVVEWRTVGKSITCHQAKEYGGIMDVHFHNNGSVRNRLLI
ncbi:unnamed protein product, partial [Coregonus sp. 'balchen']